MNRIADWTAATVAPDGKMKKAFTPNLYWCNSAQFGLKECLNECFSAD
jgi:hypothetical protein